MSVNRVNSINMVGNGMALFCMGQDEEHKRIIQRLMAYGVTPTGNKTADKEKLRQIEIKLAQQENCITSKFLTVTKSEQEKIQASRREEQREVNSELFFSSAEAQIAMGEQIYLAIQMKMKNND